MIQHHDYSAENHSGSRKRARNLVVHGPGGPVSGEGGLILPRHKLGEARRHMLVTRE